MTLYPFKPKPEVEEINYNSRVGLLEYFKQFTIFISILIVFIITLGYGGQVIVMHSGPSVEKFLLNSVSSHFDSSQEFPAGKEILASLIGDKADNYKVIVICDEDANAMAIPGLTIAVTTGLLKNIKTERGLAFVLGHEYGHFVHSDHLRGVGFNLGINLGMSLIGLDSVGKSISNLSQALIANKHSREQEEAADSVAIDVFKAKYHTLAGASEFFDYLIKDRAAAREIGVLSTHPLTTERLERIKGGDVDLNLNLNNPVIDFKTTIVCDEK